MLWTPKTFHVELSNACVAQCPFCARTTEGGTQRHQEISYDIFTNFFTPEVLKDVERISLCGSYGDPIYAKDLIKIAQYIDKNSNTGIFINTNGYNKKNGFWKQLGKTRATVTFGIDGITQYAHELHRKGTYLKTILRNAKEFIDAGGNAIWQFLVFKHNEHQIQKAQEIADRMGFSDFALRTSRDYNGELQAPEYRFHKEGIKVTTDLGVECDFMKRSEWYIASSGQVLPCCYLGEIEYYEPSLLDLKMNIAHNSLQKIQQYALWKKKIGRFTNKSGDNMCQVVCSYSGRTEAKLLKNKQEF